jgi:hypothetical protein
MEYRHLTLVLAKGKVMRQRIDVPVSVGGVWNWFKDQPVIRLDIGLLVYGHTLDELAVSLLKVLDGTAHDIGILINVGGCNLPVEKLLAPLEEVRAHHRTRAVAVLTPPYEGALRAETGDGLAYFWQESDALDWLRTRLTA